jgi:hypothetical protein
MDNLDELELQRAANRERQRRRREQGSQEEQDIQNERRRLNYLQSDSERETQNVSTTFSWKGLINVIPIYLNSCTLFLNRSGER